MFYNILLYKFIIEYNFIDFITYKMDTTHPEQYDTYALFNIQPENQSEERMIKK